MGTRLKKDQETVEKLISYLPKEKREEYKKILK